MIFGMPPLSIHGVIEREGALRVRRVAASL